MRLARIQIEQPSISLDSLVHLALLIDRDAKLFEQHHVRLGLQVLIRGQYFPPGFARSGCEMPGRLRRDPGAR